MLRYFSFSGSCELFVICGPVPLRKGSTVATNLWLSTCKLLEQVHYIHKLVENITLRASPNQKAPVETLDHVPEQRELKFQAQLLQRGAVCMICK